jgi:hypothetical protein
MSEFFKSYNNNLRENTVGAFFNPNNMIIY